MPPAATARARVRAEMTREIAEAGRKELADVGAAALSLRAVARRLGMAPSALYRYFDSRDHLLTALIVDAYDALAATALTADRLPTDNCGARWLAVSRGVRRWSARHPHEWALVFGSPVPGYVGSEQTSEAATGLHRVPFQILVDAHRLGELDPPAGAALPAEVVRSVGPLVAYFPDAPPGVAAPGLSAWGQVLGMVSLERFGHFTGVIDDLDAYFDYSVGLAARTVGLEVTTGPLARQEMSPGT